MVRLKQKFKTKVALVALFFSVNCGATMAYADVGFAKIILNSSFGVNSNPYRLSSELDPTASSYQRYKADLRFKTVSGMKLNLLGVTTQYEDNARWADEKKVAITAAYLGRFKLKKRKFSVTPELAYVHKDRSYVSRTSGEIGTLSGADMKDRYDYDQTHASLDLGYKVSKGLLIKLGVKLGQRDYYDYSELGASNYSYAFQSGLAQSKWREGMHNISLEFEHTLRRYDDKRARDSLGNTLPDTELKYRNNAVGLDYFQRLSNNRQWGLDTEYSDNRDNGLGYYNYQRIKTGVYYKQGDRSGFRWKTQLQRTSLRYTQREEADTSEEDAYTRNRWTALNTKVAYASKVFSKKLNMELYGQFKYVLNDSDYERYAYDQRLVEIGGFVRF